MLGAGLYFSNPALFGRRVDPNAAAGPASNMMPPDPIRLEESVASNTATSVEAVSKDELPGELLKVRLVSVRRVQGGKATDINVAYECAIENWSPDKYEIAYFAPDGTGSARFKNEAPRTDVVQVKLDLSSLSGRGPIEVWIQYSFGGKRVSNVMTLP